MSRPVALTLLFALGACAPPSAPVATDPISGPAPKAPPPSPATVSAKVVDLEEVDRRTAPNDLGSVAPLLRGNNAFVAHLALAPLAEIPSHRDTTEEYIVVLEGGGTLMIDGAAFQLRKGSAVLMPANAEVSYANGPEPLVALQVFAGPEPAQKYDKWTPVTKDEGTGK